MRQLALRRLAEPTFAEMGRHALSFSLFQVSRDECGQITRRRMVTHFCELTDGRAALRADAQVLGGRGVAIAVPHCQQLSDRQVCDDPHGYRVQPLDLVPPHPRK